jgi:ribose 5-phosphate isomerase B
MANEGKICIGSDHAGYTMKEMVKGWLLAEGYDVEDFGTESEASVDYPDVIHPLAKAVETGSYDRGIILCGSGNGVSITANKHPNVRAALCWNPELARMARLHNDANILSLPARYIDGSMALDLVQIFLTTAFEGGRHQLRVDKINLR